MTFKIIEHPSLEAVMSERERQDHKWGEQNHNAYRWLAILMEEVGEASEAILGADPDRYFEELTQVAAVAVAAMESCLRHGMVGKEGVER